MNTFRLTVSTPEGNIFEDEVRGISLRGSEGDLAILAGHIPFITAVKPGDCHIELSDGSTTTCYTDGGILTVAENAVTLLSGGFVQEHDHIDHIHI